MLRALISPTDPVAVLGILRSAGTPRSVEAKIAGESLFNDGAGLVVFTILVAAATGREAFSLERAGEPLAIEAGGGVLLGLGIGYLGFVVMKAVDEHNLEILITLSIDPGARGRQVARRRGSPWWFKAGRIAEPARSGRSLHPEPLASAQKAIARAAARGLPPAVPWSAGADGAGDGDTPLTPGQP